MPLTPEQIEAMNQVTGLNKSSTQTSAATTVGKSRAQELRDLGKSKTTTFGNIKKDIKETYTGIKGAFSKNIKQAKEAQQREATGEQGAFRTLAQRSGQMAGLVSDIGGELAMGAGKVLLPESTEESIKEKVGSIGESVAGFAPIKSVIEKYNSLDEKTKADIDAAIGFGSLAADVLTLGAGKAGVQASKPLIKSGIEAVKSGAKVVKEGAESLLGKVKGKVLSTADDIAMDAITPDTKDISKKQFEKLLRQNRINPKTTTKPSEYILSEREKAIANKYKNILQENDPVKNSINVMEEIANKDTQVGEFLRQNNSIFNSGELKNYITDRLKDISDVAIPEERVTKLKETITKNFLDTLEKNDMETLWKARKEFDQSIEKAFSGSPTLQKEVKKEFRNAVQEFIADKTPDEVYKTLMKDMTDLFNVQDVISLKAAKEKGRNAILVWLKNNPSKAKAVGWIAGILGGSVALDMITQ